MTPVHPRIAAHIRWMETESRFAHACPDLDQEMPADNVILLRPLKSHSWLRQLIMESLILLVGGVLGYFCIWS